MNSCVRCFCVFVRVCVGFPCEAPRVSMASLEWLIRGEVEESVRVSGRLR